MKHAPLLTARDRAALTNAARTLSRIVGELAGETPEPRRRKRRKATAKPVPVAPAKRRSLRDVPEPA